jgi:hypothetical protein
MEMRIRRGNSHVEKVLDGKNLKSHGKNPGNPWHVPVDPLSKDPKSKVYQSSNIIKDINGATGEKKIYHRIWV